MYWVTGVFSPHVVFVCFCILGFLVVDKSLSVLLQSIVMSYVDCGDDGQVV